jgi:hypothetical protein
MLNGNRMLGVSCTFIQAEATASWSDRLLLNGMITDMLIQQLLLGLNDAAWSF